MFIKKRPELIVTMEYTFDRAKIEADYADDAALLEARLHIPHEAAVLTAFENAVREDTSIVGLYLAERVIDVRAEEN